MHNNTQLDTQSYLVSEAAALSPWEILGLLKAGWYWFVGGALVGLIGAIGFVVVSPAQYEATAVIQPATVGMPTTTTTTTKGVELEPMPQTLERLKMPTFFTPELVQVCQAPSAPALASGIKSSLVKGNSLIQLSYRATSKAAAEACLNAVVGQLVKSQAMIAAPIIKILEEQLAQGRLRLREAKAFQAQLEKRTASADISSLLMLNALAKREEIARLQKYILEQDIQLSRPFTQPLQLLEPIFVPEKAVFPKKLPVFSSGLFGGLVMGALMFFVRRSWLMRRV